ncbi:hypothetical protein EOD40_17175 [Flavobacterium sufflavum]|uniref:Uncharacterized protein n=1 Tax=Flavobacterium sufflavum TaxID=1921138 RepID=A0A3S3SQE8_9FLAO|nr:hypothetical protein [Flavobacterium sufflavum]RVT71373.1 hypothetical protein EOD40_17175 [Flavobacterium sufflavum]
MKEINPNRITFYKFLNGDISKESLEHWIYENKELEKLFQKDHYIDLLAFNYKSTETRNYIKSVVKKHLDWQEFEKWRTIELLEKIKTGNIEFVLATRKLRQLYLEQEEEIREPFISIELAIGYESLLDNCPIESEYHQWNSEALKKQLEPMELYRNVFLITLEKKLTKLLNSEFH